MEKMTKVQIEEMEKQALMNGKDWKKAMEEAGFPYMEYFKSALEGVVRAGAEGWAYRAVIVELEIRTPRGYFSLERVEIPMKDLDFKPNAARILCDRVLKQIRGHLKAAGIKE